MLLFINFSIIEVFQFRKYILVKLSIITANISFYNNWYTLKVTGFSYFILAAISRIKTILDLVPRN